jgi:hypothetical protein
LGGTTRRKGARRVGVTHMRVWEGEGHEKNGCAYGTRGAGVGGTGVFGGNASSADCLDNPGRQETHSKLRDGVGEGGVH